MNERQVHEENELLRLENDQMRKAVKNVSYKAELETHVTEAETEKRSNEVIGKFRQQSQVHEESLQIIKEQYLRLQEIYLAKIRALEENLKKSNAKCKDLERRRTMEIEGFHRDIDTVKRKTRIYDEYLHRVKRLIDEKPKDVVGIKASIMNIDMANREGENELDVVPLKEQVEKLEGELEQIKVKHFESQEDEPKGQKSEELKDSQ